MAITFEPMVRFGPNFARIIIFTFHGHLKGKVKALKLKAKELMLLGHVIGQTTEILSSQLGII